MVDRYTKVILTVIAVALVWLAAQQSITSAIAARNDATPVFITHITSDAAKCIAGYIRLVGGDTGSCIATW